MSDRYPSDEELATIKSWAADRLPEWFAYIKEAGNYWPDDDYWTQEGNTYHISTGGWSGNEDIIAAMQENFSCWALTWRVHRTGGHYEFTLPAGAGATP